MTNKQEGKFSLEEIIKLARNVNNWVKYNHISGYGGHFNQSVRISVDKRGILGFLSERFILFEIEAEYGDINLGHYHINRKNHYKHYLETKEIYDKAKKEDVTGGE